MAFGEVAVDTPAYDVTALYLNSYRIGRKVSNYFMFGGIMGSGTHETTPYHSFGIIINNSIFFHFSKTFVIGIEMVLYVDKAFAESSISFYPQCFLRLSRTLKFQGGIGFVYRTGSLLPQILARFTNSGPE
jgi:hypothetical protein